MAAPYYFEDGDDPSVLRYWFSHQGRGAVANDAIGVMRRAPNPVLAHHFIDFLFDERVSRDNFEWNGYQPPVSDLDVRTLIPDHLSSTLVTRRTFNLGSMELELSPASDRAWKDVYSSFASGLPGGVT